MGGRERAIRAAACDVGSGAESSALVSLFLCSLARALSVLYAATRSPYALARIYI